MQSLLQDIRYAIRQLRKSPGFALTVILTLALGIGANTALFSVMNAVLLRSLPVRNPDRLFYLTHTNKPDEIDNTGSPRYVYGINVYNRLREDKSVFSDVIAYVPLAFSKTAVRFGDTPEEVEADEVSGNFFSALGVPMAEGQGFTNADETKHSQIAVISYGYWNRRFNHDPDVIGKTIDVNGVPLTIVGVSERHFYGVESGGTETDLWIPLQNRPELNAWGVPAANDTLYGSPNWWNLMLMARLPSGVMQQQALARINPVFANAAFETTHKDATDEKQKLELEMVPARGLGTSSADYRNPLRVLMSMVALVLLIACVNIVMLLVARNSVREREFALRLALGASRAPLFRQLLAESAILVTVGALLGWLFAVQATQLLARWSQLEVSLTPDKSVLLFTLAISALAALIFGLAPLRIASNAPVGIVLRSGGSQTTASRSKMLSGKILIAMQMAFCVVLLFGAGLLLRTLRNYENVDLGMKAKRVLAFGVHPLGTLSHDQNIAFYNGLMERLRSIPGVESVTLAEHRPGSGWSDNGPLTIDGRRYSGPQDELHNNEVGSDFFKTLEIPILAGRGITVADTKGAPNIAVVNQTLVNRYFRNANPLGHMIGDPRYHIEIVGVVRDNKYVSADETPAPMAWFSYQQDPAPVHMDVEMRVAGKPMPLLPSIRRIVREIDPNIPLDKPEVLSEGFRETYLMPALFARLAVFFAGLAALLVAVGLYGTLSYRVNRRTTEIGVRMALGAARSQVLWMVLRDSLYLVVAGLVLGLPLTWFASKLMASMLYQLSPHDPVSFIAAGLGVLAVSVVAALIPARRAMYIEPMQALRTE